MQGDPQVISHLNKVLAQQLVAINQYFLHARMYRDWGFAKLNKLDYKASIVVMCNADELIKRILFLQGLPNLQDLGRLRIGENVEEMLNSDLQQVTYSIKLLREAIIVTEQVRDYVSRELLKELLDKEEEHLDVLETELALLAQLGVQNYLQQQMQDE